MKVSQQTLEEARENGVRRMHALELRKRLAKEQPLLTAKLVERFGAVPYSASMVYFMLSAEAEGALPLANNTNGKLYPFEQYPDSLYSVPHLQNEQPNLASALKKSCYGKLTDAAKLTYEVFREMFIEGEDEKPSTKESEINLVIPKSDQHNFQQESLAVAKAAKDILGSFGASKIQFYDETTGKTTEL